MFSDTPLPGPSRVPPVPATPGRAAARGLDGSPEGRAAGRVAAERLAGGLDALAPAPSNDNRHGAGRLCPGTEGDAGGSEAAGSNPATCSAAYLTAEDEAAIDAWLSRSDAKTRAFLRSAENRHMARQSDVRLAQASLT